MTAPYRILVTGSRDWDDEQELRYALIHAATPYLPSVTVVHGACPTGADAMAGEWASNMAVAVEEHPADWERFGKAAGFRRNAEMVDAGAAICLAFIRNGSKGATHTADLAGNAGILVRRYLRGTS